MAPGRSRVKEFLKILIIILQRQEIKFFYRTFLTGKFKDKEKGWKDEMREIFRLFILFSLQRKKKIQFSRICIPFLTMFNSFHEILEVTIFFFFFFFHLGSRVIKLFSSQNLRFSVLNSAKSHQRILSVLPYPGLSIKGWLALRED